MILLQIALPLRIAISQRHFASTEFDGDGIKDGCLLFRESGTQVFVYASRGKSFRKGLVHMTLYEFSIMLTVIWMTISIYEKFNEKK